MDDLYFSKNTLVDFADMFVKMGGKYLFLDEIHKYRNWSQEIKNCYDYFPGLKIVVTGSSALNIYKGKADLSRRAILYKMQGLSFREFIALKYKYYFPVLELVDRSISPIIMAFRSLPDMSLLFPLNGQWPVRPLCRSTDEFPVQEMNRIVNAAIFPE